jgi:hypothetical protein
MHPTNVHGSATGNATVVDMIEKSDGSACLEGVSNSVYLQKKNHSLSTPRPLQRKFFFPSLHGYIAWQRMSPSDGICSSSLHSCRRASGGSGQSYEECLQKYGISKNEKECQQGMKKVTCVRPGESQDLFACVEEDSMQEKVQRVYGLPLKGKVVGLIRE